MAQGSEDSRPTIAFAASAVAMLVVFRLLDVVVTHLAALPASAYFGERFLDDLPAQAWHIVARRIPLWLVAVALAVGAALLVVDAKRWGGSGRRGVSGFVQRLTAGWGALEDGKALRLLVLAITGITMWPLATYARNLYVDQLHLADRLLLVVLWLAIAWRPLVALPYAIVAGAVAGQFTVPLGFISWTEMGILLHLPVLLTAFLAVRATTGAGKSDVLIFCWCCLVAVTFWTSGLGKLRVGWFAHPHVILLMLGAHANAWLGYLDADTIVRAAAVLERATRPLMVMTLVLECGALVLLWRRWSLLAFFVLATGFHLAVFAMTGICFWKWVAADASLLVFLLHRGRLQRLALFSPGRFALSVAIVAASPLWIRAENLTWFDTPLTYSLRFSGVDASGTAHELPPAFFRPYGDAFVLGTFPAVSPYVQLTRGMGVTADRSLAEALVRARSSQDVFALEARMGTTHYDTVADAALRSFLGRYAAGARCATERDPALLRFFGAPRHLWTSPLHEMLPCATRLRSIQVVERTTFFDGENLRIIRERPIMDVEVPADSSPRSVTASARRGISERDAQRR